MCAGYELCSFKPTTANMSDLKMYSQVVDLLGIIFERTTNRYCTIEELLAHSFFRNIDLREMRSTSVTVSTYTFVCLSVTLKNRQNQLSSIHSMKFHLISLFTTFQDNKSKTLDEKFTFAIAFTKKSDKCVSIRPTYVYLTIEPRIATNLVDKFTTSVQ